MPFPRIAGQVGRLSAGQNILVARHYAATSAARTLRSDSGRVNHRVANFSSHTNARTTVRNSFSTKTTALAAATLLVAGGSGYYTLKSNTEAEKAQSPRDVPFTQTPAEFTAPWETKVSYPTLGRSLATNLTHRSVNQFYDTLSPDQVSELLHKDEISASLKLGRDSVVLRFDNNTIPCNDPIEDDHDEFVVSKDSGSGVYDNGEWAFWGIYDGHSGWATSAKLRQSLIPRVYSDLRDLYIGATSPTKNATSVGEPTDAEVTQAIKTSFLRLDHEIVWSHIDTVIKANSKALATRLLAPALAGSCALLAFYDTSTQLLRVACTGDCRAVLGRRVDANTWLATPLSSDQTGANPDEIARIQSEHPDEKDVTKNGRLLGYEPSRVFGDASLKWPRKLSLTIREYFYGKFPSEKVITPPYATAEPVVTTTRIHPEKGDFVVMACDGLWEMLSNEEVVALVVEWIDKKSQLASNGTTMPEKGRWSGLFGSKNVDKSVIKLPPVVSSPDSDRFYALPPNRPRQWKISDAPDSTGGRRREFVIKDANAATHLIRNGLGGGDHDLISSLLMLGGKNARRFRDDLTVTVIFFGEP